MRGKRRVVITLSGHPGYLSGGAGGLALAMARAYADTPADGPFYSASAAARLPCPMLSTALATLLKRCWVSSEKSM